MILTAVVDIDVDENRFVYVVLCYEDDEYTHRFYFANRDDAEVMKERWESGRSCARHLAITKQGLGEEKMDNGV